MKKTIRSRGEPYVTAAFSTASLSPGGASTYRPANGGKFISIFVTKDTASGRSFFAHALSIHLGCPAAAKQGAPLYTTSMARIRSRGETPLAR